MCVQNLVPIGPQATTCIPSEGYTHRHTHTLLYRYKKGCWDGSVHLYHKGWWGGLVHLDHKGVVGWNSSFISRGGGME